MKALNVVVLAAGKGTRMKSALPKVLHLLAGKPLLQHVLDTASQLAPSKISLVIGHGAEDVRRRVEKQNVECVLQEQQLGTAHAVHQALGTLEADALALVMFGDVPLVQKETLASLLARVDENSMGVLTCHMQNPFGLGRIVRNANGDIERIVEQKDATEEERKIQEINTGIMAIPVRHLQKWLPRIQSNNAQKEYYLTDIVALALQDGCRVITAESKDEKETAGVNDRIQLADLERHYQRREAEKLMKEGVTLRDPDRFDLRGTLQAGMDVDIDINAVLEGNVVIGNNVVIGANCTIKNCVIGDNTVIKTNSVLEDSSIGKNCTIGPFARIRPGTEISDEAKVGNFVEVKKSRIGRDSKINHLSYVGDSELGVGVNIGAGTITCNYDGVNKFKTIIGDNVFIGSNTALVAPVTVASGATVGAGSVITRNVGEQQLAIARGKQVNIDGWRRPTKQSKNSQK